MSHSNSSNTYTVVSRQEFDKAGRLLRLFKNFNNTAFKQLAEYSYNESGQLKTKRLAPGYTGTGKNEIETQTFDYNIHGSLIGINKDYALHAGNYNQWNNYFGMYLGYDNRDGVFSGARYDGSITGLVWKSQGDNSPRRYDFTYDGLDRFESALFQQKTKPADAWSNASVDFSVYAQYEDGNGNLKSLKQMSVVPGTGIVSADDLKYFYRDVPGVAGLTGNQLQRVDDQGTMGSNNGLLNDFKDGANVAGADDYSYDANGNLVKDLNKNIVNGSSNGITYNYLDKPVKIVLQNKSVVEYTYDAAGEKISKKVTNTATGTGRTTYYSGDFVYEENILQ